MVLSAQEYFTVFLDFLKTFHSMCHHLLDFKQNLKTSHSFVQIQNTQPKSKLSNENHSVFHWPQTFHCDDAHKQANIITHRMTTMHNSDQYTALLQNPETAIYCKLTEVLQQSTTNMKRCTMNKTNFQRFIFSNSHSHTVKWYEKLMLKHYCNKYTSVNLVNEIIAKDNLVEK